MVLVHVIFAAFATAFVLLFPSEASAWGPGMHVEVALGALANLENIAPVIAGLMERFPEAFIYGATSPDIIVGKKFAGLMHHCHNWRMGRMILEAAKDDRQRSSAYGYLMHLAADIVAHNYYIPFKIIRGWNARLLTHTYWEMRFDIGVCDEAWRRLDEITELDVEEFDELLDRVLRRTIFSFSTNKRIFNTIIMLQRLKGLRRSLKLYASRSRYAIGVENRQHYFDLAMEAALSFLKDPDGSPSLAVDPAGLEKLDYAKSLRRDIRNLANRGRITERTAEGFVELVKERLAVGLYRPEMKLPTVRDVL